MTRAECLAEYIGLTYEAHSWAYRERWRNFGERYFALNLPDPLLPGTDADAWLGPLLRCGRGVGVDRLDTGLFIGYCEHNGQTFRGRHDTPTAAIVNAMLAADTALRTRWEKCND